MRKILLTGVMIAGLAAASALVPSGAGAMTISTPAAAAKAVESNVSDVALVCRRVWTRWGWRRVCRRWWGGPAWGWGGPVVYGGWGWGGGWGRGCWNCGWGWRRRW